MITAWLETCLCCSVLCCEVWPLLGCVGGWVVGWCHAGSGAGRGMPAAPAAALPCWSRSGAGCTLVLLCCTMRCAPAASLRPGPAALLAVCRCDQRGLQCKSWAWWDSCRGAPSELFHKQAHMRAGGGAACCMDCSRCPLRGWQYFGCGGVGAAVNLS